MALTAERDTQRLGDDAVIDLVRGPQKGTTKIFKGALCCYNGGYIAPMTAATGLVAAGVADKTYDNSSGADGDVTVQVRQGCFGFAISGADPVTQADCGNSVYAVDDLTIAKTDGGAARSVAGKLLQVMDGLAWVEVLPAMPTVTVTGVTTGDLASNANGKGASLVGIEDALGLITGTTAEAALAELAKYIPISLADPGTGVAIPVTRSATVNIVTAAAETNTLAIPTFLGQKLILNMDTRVGGDRVVTSAQRINQAGNTVMTFGAVGDCIVLEAVKIGGALRWQVVANDGVALA